MRQKKLFLTAPSWLLFFLIVFPQTCLLQGISSLGFDAWRTGVTNFYNVLVGGTSTFLDDINNASEHELDDMTPEDLDTFDFIVVGAGSAGAAVASRLSEAKDTTVLLIEAGKEENLFTDLPLLALYLQLDKTGNYDYKMERSPNYCRGFEDGRCKMPRGKIMGGSSVLNFMIATLGNYRDYDNWEKMGGEGWSYKDVFPILKRMQNYTAWDLESDPKYHSVDGPLHIDSSNYYSVSSKTFLKAGAELDFPILDYDGEEMIGYAYIHSTTKNGTRFSSNKAYLYPAKNRPNLFLTKFSFVEKILIHSNNKRAYGVLFNKNDKKIRALARKEVIVCAGAINSPKLLMLSGIGPAEHLRKLNIPVLKDAPVGKNLMDHITYWGLNFLVNETITILTSDLFRLDSPDVGDYFEKREGPLTAVGGTEAMSFLNVDDRSLREGLPNMELLFAGISLAEDPVAYKVLAMKEEYYQASLGNLKNKYSFMILPTLLKPLSRGEVLLRSKNPNDDPRIIPNYFSHPDDMKRMIKGIREAERLSRTKAYQKYNSHLPNNTIIGCEGFERNSDLYWDCAIRTYANTLYHPTGTCKMGARNDKTAVVDPRLKVIGISGLRVADASIMPEIIAGHPNVPTMMIGEKLSDLVKEDWELV